MLICWAKTMRMPHWSRSGAMRLLAFAISAAIIARPAPAAACKDRKYPESLPVEELQGYSTVAVVKVGKVDPPAGTAWQAPPIRPANERNGSTLPITEPTVVRQILDHLRVRASPLPRGLDAQETHTISER
jgi:hypothetical protein